MARPRKNPSDLPPLEKKRVTASTMSRELKIMAMTSLGFVGGVKYLEKVAKTNPSAYLAFLAKTLVVRDVAEEQGETTFVVRTLNIIAQPTPGVINSPVAGHIAAPRLIAQSGEIIDNEAVQGHG